MKPAVSMFVELKNDASSAWNFCYCFHTCRSKHLKLLHEGCGRQPWFITCPTDLRPDRKQLLSWGPQRRRDSPPERRLSLWEVSVGTHEAWMGSTKIGGLLPSCHVLTQLLPAMSLPTVGSRTMCVVCF